jgi:uncharacterized membrane protein YccC
MAWAGAARVRNFSSYGCLIAGYSALLIGFEGLGSPNGAWMIAVDRSAEIVIGIGCSTAATLIIAPTYAGDMLRRSLRKTYAGLMNYAAKAVTIETTAASFSATRRQMLADVAQFDSLQSFAAFEAPDMRALRGGMHYVMREFLGILAVARSLYVRIEGADHGDATPAVERTERVLSETRLALEAIARMDMARDATQVRRDLSAATTKLRQAREHLATEAGTVPFDQLANALLILSRTHDMIRRLALVMMVESASFRLGAPASRHERLRSVLGPTEAVLQALRAALALLLVTGFWQATGWSSGFSAVSGIAIVVFFLVNQDDPGKVAWPYIRGVTLAYCAAFFVTLYILPRLEGFAALAICLCIVLFPAGLLIGTPRFAFFGVGFGAFFIVGMTGSNEFDPNAKLFVNNAVALLLGLVAFIFVSSAILPISPRLIRRQAWIKVVMAMATAARGPRTDRAAGRDILIVLAELLSRLNLSHQEDEDFLRGCLGAASTCHEIGRLSRLSREPGMPPAIAEAINGWLETVAAMYESLRMRHIPGPLLARGEAATRHLYSQLSAAPLSPHSDQARLVIQAAACLRFVIDHFDSDRVFLQHGFALKAVASR